MATYVALSRWTEQGIKNVKDTLQRSQRFRADCERRGIKVLGVYWTQGRYDMVAFVDAPDEHTIMAEFLAMESLGSIRTEKLRAFTETEMDTILRKM